MLFLKTVFRKKERSFKVNWYSKFPWLHCDIECDSVYCYTCMAAHTKGHKVLSGNSDPAFITRGFCNCKKCGERFLDYQNSVIHKDYESLVRLVEQMLI